MNNTTIQFYNKQIHLQRILYSFRKNKTAPTVIFFGGIHGNEPAGIYGLIRVIEQIKDNNISLKANFYAITGNLNALKKNIRYEKADLNRLWTNENIANLKDSGSKKAEQKEQLELYELIKNILSKNNGLFYFIDLHTTSSETIPFITISDSLENRKFAANFSIPIILGIEEFLEGPLLTFINEFGHISLGFEAGQHEDEKSVDNCEAFIWKILVVSGCINKSDIHDFNKYLKVLDRFNRMKDFFEIDYRYLLNNGEDFMMFNDFKNFEAIEKGEIVALSNAKEIKANINGLIFMPLYQKQGNDGFFIINKVSKLWLQLSSLARKLNLHHTLRLLPGIKQDYLNKHTLIVNPKTAKFLTTEIFHLFGYRKKIVKNNKLYFIKRDRTITDFF